MSQADNDHRPVPELEFRTLEDDLENDLKNVPPEKIAAYLEAFLEHIRQNGIPIDFDLAEWERQYDGETRNQ